MSTYLESSYIREAQKRSEEFEEHWLRQSQQLIRAADRNLAEINRKGRVGRLLKINRRRSMQRLKEEEAVKLERAQARLNNIEATSELDYSATRLEDGSLREEIFGRIGKDLVDLAVVSGHDETRVYGMVNDVDAVLFPEVTDPIVKMHRYNLRQRNRSAAGFQASDRRRQETPQGY